MHRARLIELSGLASFTLSHSSDRLSTAEKQFEEARREVRIVHPQHLDRDVWEQEVEPLRTILSNNAMAAFDAMRAASRDKVYIAHCLAEYYTLPEMPEPAMACGVCPACRRKSHDPYSSLPPVGEVPWSLTLELLAVTPPPSWLKEQNIRAVTYGTEDLFKLREQLFEAVNKLAQRGFRQIVLPPDFSDDLDRIQRATPPLFLSKRYAPLKCLMHLLW